MISILEILYDVKFFKSEKSVSFTEKGFLVLGYLTSPNTLVLLWGQIEPKFIVNRDMVPILRQVVIQLKKPNGKQKIHKTQKTDQAIFHKAHSRNSSELLLNVFHGVV